jgi:hypothetical protein
MKWLSRDERRDTFKNVLDLHLLPRCCLRQPSANLRGTAYKVIYNLRSFALGRIVRNARREQRCLHLNGMRRDTGRRYVHIAGPEDICD